MKISLFKRLLGKNKKSDKPVALKSQNSRYALQYQNFGDSSESKRSLSQSLPLSIDDRVSPNYPNYSSSSLTTQVLSSNQKQDDINKQLDFVNQALAYEAFKKAEQTGDNPNANYTAKHNPTLNVDGVASDVDQPRQATYANGAAFTMHLQPPQSIQSSSDTLSTISADTDSISSSRLSEILKLYGPDSANHEFVRTASETLSDNSSSLASSDIYFQVNNIENSDVPLAQQKEALKKGWGAIDKRQSSLKKKSTGKMTTFRHGEVLGHGEYEHKYNTPRHIFKPKNQ